MLRCTSPVFVVVAVCFFSTAFTPTPLQAQDYRAWLDVNFIGATPRQDAQVYEFHRTMFNEVASSLVSYPEMGTAKGPEFAGGFTFGPGIGIGVRFLRVKAEYIPGLAIRIPHPNFFNRHADDARPLASPLTRNDRDLDIMVSYDLPTPDAWRIRFSGGPTYFFVKQEMVGEIIYNQAWLGLANAVEITQGNYSEIDGSAWGINVGADVAYFFTRHVGAGATVRFNAGTVTIDEPLSGEEADLKAGRTAFGAGLRLRF